MDVDLVAFVRISLAYLLEAFHLVVSPCMDFHLVASILAYLPFDIHRQVVVIAFLEVAIRTHLVSI